MNIPIYRAKKINNDEYFTGHYMPTWAANENGEYSNLKHFLFKDIADEDEEAEDFNGFSEIDVSTLAIHLCGAEDSNGKKIFASLDTKSGVGGDIIMSKNHYFSIADEWKSITEPVILENGIITFDDSRLMNQGLNIEIVGIQE